MQARPDDTVILLPQADGGEGTLDAIEAATPTAVRHRVGPVTGPDGRPTPGEFLELPHREAVVELAQCSGLPLMREPDALHATTRGLGEVIRSANEAGMRSIVIALGGSASTDGGSGALAALGLGLLDSRDSALQDGGGALVSLERVTTDGLLPPPPDGVTLLADVTAPLLGKNGAARVFGPQKGADADGIRILEAGLSRLAAVLGGDPDAPGSGAAGGTAYGFTTLWGATVTSGARTVQRLTGLSEAIATADVVITGEGRFDASSATGKVVGELLALAAGHGVRTGVIAGQVAAPTTAWTCALAELAGSAEAALADPMQHLERAGREAAEYFGSGFDTRRTLPDQR